MISLGKVCKFVCSAILFFAVHAVADWPCSSEVAIPISTSPGNQWNVRLVSDGGNGAIIAWQDRRNGLNDKIYLQKLSSAGVPQWTPGGTELAVTGGFQYYPQLIADGQGGAFIVWQDNRSGADYDIFAQHISSNGSTLWYPNGALVCNASGHQYNPQLVSDGAGGIVVTWQDRRGGQFDIYAQRFDAAGQPQWQANGEVVCNAQSDQFEPKLVGDGNGGAVVAWIDYRAGNGFTDIYCQRILSGGTTTFPENGIPVCVAPNTQWNIQMTDDGLGNCIVAWQDRRAGSYDNIYAQKIDGGGNALWNADGIPLAPLSGVQYYPQMASDQSGGAVITWQDNRLGNDYNIYAQHVGANGQAIWSPGGLPVCSSLGHQYNPQIVSQDKDFIITWQDKRGGDFDIYAQRVTADGVVMWKMNGEPVAKLPYDQFLPQLVSDNVHGAVLAWADFQAGGGTTDVYAHRIGANGKLAGGCYRTFPQQVFNQKSLRIRQRNKSYVLNKPNEGNVRDSVFGRGAFATGLVLGIERRDSNRNYGWEYFTRSFYVRKALPQNGAARPFDYIFDRKFVNRLRNPSVYRYDNRLAGELLTLRLNIAASDVGITEPGLGDLIYHDTSETPGMLNNRSLRKVAATVDSTLTYYMRYRGVDYPALANALAAINGAFTGPLDTTSTSPLRITSMGALFDVSFLVPGIDPPTILPHFVSQQVEEEIPGGYALFQNYPNPFNPVTTIEFSINEPSMVTLKVYNALGQEVAALVDNVLMDEGRQLMDFDASRLSSGVYFYRLVADPISAPGRLTSTVKKMILLK